MQLRNNLLKLHKEKEKRMQNFKFSRLRSYETESSARELLFSLRLCPILIELVNNPNHPPENFSAAFVQPVYVKKAQKYCVGCLSNGQDI